MSTISQHFYPATSIPGISRRLPYTTTGTIDKQFLSCLQVPCVKETLNSQHCCLRYARCLVESHAGRHQCQRRFRCTDIFCERTKTTLAQVAIHVIPGLKSHYVFANRFNVSRDVTAGYLNSWFGFQETGKEPRKERLTVYKRPVPIVYGSRMDFYQDLIVVGGRCRDFLQSKHIRRSVFCEYNRFQELLLCYLDDPEYARRMSGPPTLLLPGVLSTRNGFGEQPLFVE